MADHWVSDVFPPKFQFSLEEFLKKSPGNERDDVRGSHKSTRKIMKDVYEKVFQEIVAEQRRAELEEDVDSWSAIVSSETCNDLDISKKLRESRKDRFEREKRIWSAEEMDILRKVFQKTKFMNLQLVGMIDAVKADLKSWKEKAKQLGMEYDICQASLYEKSKKNKRMKIVCQALKGDLREYHQRLKCNHEDLKKLKTERISLRKDLNETRKQLAIEKLQKQQLVEEMTRNDKEMDALMASRESHLKQQYLHEISQLRYEIQETKSTLEKEQGEHALCKKALEQFRSHFSNMQLQNSSKSLHHENILSVTDIECILDEPPT